MTDKPYALNQPIDRLWHEVARRIEAQLQASGVMVSFDSLPAVEDLIDQYNRELTRAWDENNRLEQKLRQLRGDHESEA